jgi:hypothetical protein
VCQCSDNTPAYKDGVGSSLSITDGTERIRSDQSGCFRRCFNKKKKATVAKQDDGSQSQAKVVPKKSRRVRPRRKASLLLQEQNYYLQQLQHQEPEQKLVLVAQGRDQGHDNDQGARKRCSSPVRLEAEQDDDDVDDDSDSDNSDSSRTRLPEQTFLCPASDAGHRAVACLDRHGPMVT